MFQYPRIEFFHKLTRRIGPIPDDDSFWPDSWKTVEFKEYPRFPNFPLPAPEFPDVNFRDVLENRMSYRSFSPGPIDSKTLSTALKYAAGISRRSDSPERSTRFYPSGGARYPLELYLSLRGNGDIPTGLYHYNVRTHSLEQVGDEEADTKLRGLRTYRWVRDAAVIGFITGVFDRSMRKYAERGYRFTLIEAGVLLENLYLATNALSLGCCGVGSNNDELIEEVLDIDGTDEAFIQQFVFGPIQS